MLQAGQILRRGSQKPPFGVNVLDGGLRQDLTFAILLNQGGGNRVESLIDHVGGTFAGSPAPVWTGSVYDNRAVGSAGGIDFGTTQPGTTNLAQGAFTFFARVWPGSTFSSGGLARRNDANAVNQGWEILCYSAGTGLVIERNTTNFGVKTTAALTSLKWQNVAIAYPGDLTAANTKIYYDGVIQTHATDQNGSGTQGSDATRNFFVGNANFTNISLSSGVFLGMIDCVYIWKRFLRHEEILKLQMDPYTPFRDNLHPMYFRTPQTGAPFNFPAFFFAA